MSTSLIEIIREALEVELKRCAGTDQQAALLDIGVRLVQADTAREQVSK